MPFFELRPVSTLRDLPRRMAAWIVSLSFSLHPSSFALVMATGIVSNALYLEGYRELSQWLFGLNAIAYPYIALLTLVRAFRLPEAVWADLTDPRFVFTFFTLIASNGVFGSALYSRGVVTEAMELWLLSLPVWAVLMYLSFGVYAFCNTSRLADIVDGGWLLAIVATQSLAILGTLIAPSAGHFSGTILVFVHMLWGIATGLYAIYVALFSYRLFYIEVRPDDLTPVLWVVMGAAAISTNAGSTLLLKGSAMPSLAALRPFVEGVTLILWAWAAWWIPLLLLFGVWKHGICRLPLAYEPALWDIVFPLGMFAVASHRLSLAAEFPPLQALSVAMMWISVAAWCATFLGLAIASWRGFREFLGADGRSPDVIHSG
jgi:tellurite resistance protein TehA-like permease